MLRIIISIFLIDQAFAVILEDGLCPSLDSEAAIDLNRVRKIIYCHKQLDFIAKELHTVLLIL